MIWKDVSERYPGRAEGFTILEAADGQVQIEIFPNGDIYYSVNIEKDAPNVEFAKAVCESIFVKTKHEEITVLSDVEKIVSN